VQQVEHAVGQNKGLAGGTEFRAFRHGFRQGEQLWVVQFRHGIAGSRSARAL
jgi:hypothetical protein